MPDVHELFSLASDGDVAVSPSEDLNRARGALIRHRRRRARMLSTGVAGLAVIAAAGVVVANSGDQTNPPANVLRAQGALRLVDSGVTEGPYSFGKVPYGWSVQGATPSSVAIIPPGPGVDQDPTSFLDKLVIMYDQNPLGGTSTVTAGGRTYGVQENSDYTTISVATLPGQPEGVVRVQYPNATGWSKAVLREFLASVTVNDTAAPGLG